MENIEPLYDKKLQCPICSANFTSKKVRTKFIKVNTHDTDFCPTYEEGSVNGLLYNVFVCPECGYAYSEDFSKYFPPSTKESIQEKIQSHWTPHNFSQERTIPAAIQTYKLAAYVASLKKEKHIVIAGLHLRTAWLYRMANKHEKEQRFMKMAIEEYSNSYSTEDYKGTQVSDVRILYLLGELSRRTNQYDEAVKYFSMVIERRKTTVETKLVDMAVERYHEMKESKKQDKCN